MTAHHLSVLPDVPPAAYWDHALLDDLCGDDVPLTDAGVVILPGAGHAGHERKVADVIPEGRTLVVTSDEEHRFDLAALDRPDLTVWRQYARPDDGSRPFLVGYTPHLRPNLAAIGDVERTVDVSFAGQVTHDRRRQAVAAVEGLGGKVWASEGFTQGLTPDVYAYTLASSRIVACPSGPCHPDTFRIYEALEAGCVPLVDGRAPGWDHDWWPAWQFGGEVPFPVVTEWSAVELGPVVTHILGDWPWWAARCSAWWAQQKLALAGDGEGLA